MSLGSTVSRRFVVCQLGARMHYAVPRFLSEAGRLERFYTDLYPSRGLTRVIGAWPERVRPSSLRRLMGRGALLPGPLVRSYPAFGLLYGLRNRWAGDSESASATFLWAGRSFGRRVVRDGFGRANAVYAFNTAALEILTAARGRGLVTVLEQTIAPRQIEEALLHDEQARHPGWEPPRARGASAAQTIAREKAEWALADLIVCGSAFVRAGIGQCGGPVERCAVVPYGVEASFERRGPAPPVERPLRVLTVGHVALRKGAPYALAAAEMLGGAAEFRWVGPIMIRPEAAAQMSRHVRLAGAVPRADVRAHYEWADVFFLPSVCEGSATVTYEALASGLPVITTPSAGSPVRDGVDGFVVGDRDTAGMAARLRQLQGDRALLARLADGAAAGAPALSLAAYRQRLLPLLLDESKS